jgi:hypothetical protein
MAWPPGLRLVRRTNRTGGPWIDRWSASLLRSSRERQYVIALKNWRFSGQVHTQIAVVLLADYMPHSHRAVANLSGTIQEQIGKCK